MIIYQFDTGCAGLRRLGRVLLVVHHGGMAGGMAVACVHRLKPLDLSGLLDDLGNVGDDVGGEGHVEHHDGLAGHGAVRVHEAPPVQTHPVLQI